MCSEIEIHPEAFRPKGLVVFDNAVTDVTGIECSVEVEDCSDHGWSHLILFTEKPDR